MKANYLQNKVGYFGVFNGSRFRNEIVPASGNSMPRFKEIDGFFDKGPAPTFLC
jgi:poly-beta-hydroxyalkanoate depolymerase